MHSSFHFSAITGFVKDQFTPAGKGSITDGEHFIKINVLCSKSSELLDIAEGTNVTVAGELVFKGNKCCIFILSKLFLLMIQNLIVIINLFQTVYLKSFAKITHTFG